MPLAVVTGATQGLGLHTAAAIAATPGWDVVLAVRDVQRGHEVATRIAAERAVGVVELDLAALRSVRAAAAHLASEYAPIDALVLNAGIQIPRADHVTADGFELTFGVNHLGHFLLAELLRPNLAPAARVAVVSSGTHFGTFAKSGPFPAPRWRHPRALARPDGGRGQVAYATSKLANVLFVAEAARRYAPVTVNAYDPGLMPGTGLARGYPAWARALYACVEPLLVRALSGATRPDASGSQLARLATDPAYADLTGAYIEIDHPIEPSPVARDPERARELWTVSQQLVGLDGSPSADSASRH